MNAFQSWWSIPLKTFFGLSLLLSFFTLGGGEFLVPASLKADITVIPTSGNLAERFKDGKFHFKDILEFALYLIKTAGMLAGTAYMLANLFAGIQYIMGPLADDKEAGKNSMTNAAIGLAVVLLSWIVVDIVLSFVTG